MHPRIQELLDYLDAQHAVLRSAVDAVPAEKRNESPAPGRWSTAGILEHLATVETSITRLITDRVAAARAAGLRAETDASSVVASFPGQSVVLDRTRRIVASERVHPTQKLTADAAWQALEAARTQLCAAVMAADGLALGEITHPHPVFGVLNLYHWVAFVGGHEARHAAQVRELATS